MEEQLFSVSQVGILLKVHPLTVRRYIKEGKLKALRIAGNIRIPKSYLDDFSQEVKVSRVWSKPVPRGKKITEFSPDDAIFRLKGRGVSITRNMN